jgi:hypothetical protein
MPRLGTATTRVLALLAVTGLGAAGLAACSARPKPPPAAAGAFRHVTNLAAPTHDTGGAVLSGRDIAFGGGSATSVPTVQAFAPGAPGMVIGHLPQPRSDLVSATLGGVADIAGGYDGLTVARTVLATTDGRNFSRVANLPVPFRYPAITVAGHAVWLFGGEQAGAPVAVIQRVEAVHPRVHA